MAEEYFKDNETFDFTENGIAEIQENPDLCGNTEDESLLKQIPFFNGEPGCFHDYAERAMKRILENGSLSKAQLTKLIKDSKGANDAVEKV